VSRLVPAINSVNRALTSFHPGAVPRLARLHYRRELVAWMLLPVMMGAVEGGVVSVLAKNAFEGAVAPTTLNLVVAVLTGPRAQQDPLSGGPPDRGRGARGRDCRRPP
jgi:hypothetical protein